MVGIRSTLAVAVVALACGTGPTDPRVSLITEIGGAEFVLVEGTAAIPFTVTNASTETTFYLAACNDILTTLVDRREGRMWVNYSSGICLANLSMVPVVLGPGELLRSTLAVRDAGTYRLSLVISTDRLQRSESSKASSSFVVR